MRSFVARPHSSFKGGVSPLGDKSIAHRAAIISAISLSEVRIENFPSNDDCLATLSCLKNLGVKARIIKNNKFALAIDIKGKGLRGLRKPASPIFIKESGTTFRILSGVLAGQDFTSTLKAGPVLSKRPMARITVPLRKMGALVKSKIKNPCLFGRQEKSKIEEYPPLEIKGGNLKAITYKMPVASAQVKSAILLAALYASGRTCVIEPLPTRDHTERMFKLFRADIKTKRNKIMVNGGKELSSPPLIYIPGDISSAAFFMVLGLITARSKITIHKVSLNPSRMGILRVLKRMGGQIQIKNQRLKIKDSEPIGDIIASSSRLRGVRVGKKEIPSLIDELPILMVAACFAKGRSVFEGVEELHFKETDRIRSMSENLLKMGAGISIEKKAGVENIVIRPCGRLLAAKVRSFGDHRTAMSMIVAGLAAEGATVIDDISCLNKSFPNFISLVNLLKQ